MTRLCKNLFPLCRSLQFTVYGFLSCGICVFKLEFYLEEKNIIMKKNNVLFKLKSTILGGRWQNNSIQFFNPWIYHEGQPRPAVDFTKLFLTRY